MTVYLLDSYAMIYRAYYAFLSSPRMTSKGVNTSAVFGYVNTVIDILSKRKPDFIAAAFDVHGPTFRHELYPQYKANRDAQPEDITIAVPYIRQFLAAMNIPIVECAGFEADDVIGTLANHFSPQVDTVYMVTGDKDYAQLVHDNIRMYRLSTKGFNDWGVPEVCEHWGIQRPEQVIDLLGLWGDSSDNIPGCPGVGEKRATELLQNYGSIEGVYAQIDSVKGKLRENLINNREQVELSRKLAVINTNVEACKIDLETCRSRRPNFAELDKLFAELEFKNVLSRVRSLYEVQQPLQPSLFDDIPVEAQVEEPAVVLDSAASVKHDYVLIQTDEEVEALAAQLANAKLVCFDTETTGVDAMQADIVGLSLSIAPHKAYYIAFPDDKAATTTRLEKLKPLFADESIEKVGQNMKYDLEILRHYGVEVRGTLYDTMIAHFLLFPSQRHNMDDMAAQLLNYQTIHIDELIGKGAKQVSMRSVPLSRICEYAAEDADITLQLWLVLRDELEKAPSQKKLFLEMEMPLMSVLTDMEYAGVCIDTNALRDFSEHLKQRIAEAEKKIYDFADEEFNISSPKKVGEILFDKLKIDPNAKKTRTGQYSTSEETLTKLTHNHPIIGEILSYRGLQKLLSTYSEALPELVNPRTGRIHTSFNQAVVVTGRLSSTNPNLQNIPVRDEDGREVRKAFVASDSEHVILAADYSQVELRIMAHFSGDEHLIAAFQKGEDIHAATAAKVFKVDIGNVTRDMRRKAKTANFGIIYGISAFGLSERLDIPRKEAKDIIDGYFESFPGVRSYMDHSIEQARKDGYVETMFGRRRTLEDINSRNATVRSMAERNAINAPIQGTAADIIKIAMINIQREMKARKLKSQMILQVHDELVFDACRSELDELKSLVKEKMESACEMRVPLLAELGVGDNWLEAH